MLQAGILRSDFRRFSQAASLGRAPAQKSTDRFPESLPAPFLSSRKQPRRSTSLPAIPSQPVWVLSYAYFLSASQALCAATLLLTDGYCLYVQADFSISADAPVKRPSGSPVPAVRFLPRLQSHRQGVRGRAGRTDRNEENAPVHTPIE